MPSLSIVTGRLVEATTGYPLAGLQLVAIRGGAVGRVRAARDLRSDKDALGSAVSDAEGRFRFALPIGANPQKMRWPLQRSPLTTCVLCVEQPAGGAYLLTSRIAIPCATPLTLRVPLPERSVTPAQWVAFGNRLETARIGRLHEAVRQLLAPPPATGIFADWDVETRLSIVAALEQAFLDPHGVLRASNTASNMSVRFQPTLRPATGAVHTQHALRTSTAKSAATSMAKSMAKSAEVVTRSDDTFEVRRAYDEMQAKIRTFGDIASVDWPIDPKAFQAGDPVAGVTRFESLYRTGTSASNTVISGAAHVGGAGSTSSPIDQLPTYSDLVKYRDYLRAIWTELNKNTNRADETQAIDILNRRFHQDFRTLDTSQQAANEVLIGILRSILLTTGGESHGFGRAPADLAVRGSRSARDYLDLLISLTGYSAQEIGLRFRVDLQRSDSELSSAVQENISTLQGFYRDSFQLPPETPPIIPPATFEDRTEYEYPWPTHISPPFFLEYEEWLASTRPFFAENFYQIRPDYPLGVVAPGPLYAAESADEAKRRGIEYSGLDFTALNAALQAGLTAKRAQEYGEATKQYNLAAAAASTMILSAIKGSNFQVATLDSYPETYGIIFTALSDDAVKYFKQRRSTLIANRSGLADLLNMFDLVRDADNRPYKHGQFSLVHLLACVFPVLYGDLALARGNYAEAVAHYLRAVDPSFIVGRATMDNSAGWDGIYTAYQDGDLPFTFDVNAMGHHPDVTNPDPAFLRRDVRQVYPDASILISHALTHPVEERFFRLRLGAALLDWADALYRRDDPSSSARARELYKGVLLLHGAQPPTAPDWGSHSLVTTEINKAVTGVISSVLSSAVSSSGSGSGASYVFDAQNPAVTSQIARARMGFYQLAAGLNYYGYHDDMVPSLRYRPLKDAADQFTALAKGAQQDWLAFMGKIEDAARDSIVTANMLKRTNLQMQINRDQVIEAQYAVDQAKQQVDAVRAAIEAKRKEIEDHDSFWGQVSDFASGFKDVFSSMKPDLSASTATDATGSSSSAAAAAEASGSSAAEAQSAAALAAGGSIMLGYGAFYYASYKSLSGMADAANQRNADLAALENKALPAAQKFVSIKQTDLEMTHLQGSLVQSDADLAHDLISFQATRTLSPDFWADVASVMQRVLRRYLELGARTAWLAERALAYEQDRALRIVRFDYFPTQLYGYTGADLLQADLAELEASRLASIRSTIPIKHTFSLLRDFPLQFGQLMKTGRCEFRTDEAVFQLAYPGAYAYRIRAVTAQAVSVETRPTPRGLLTNQGISQISQSDGTSEISVRPSDAFALSEFRLSSDMAVYGLPDEALFAFEGSGVDTFWRLEFPSAANAFGRDGLADVLLTIDARASFSTDLYRTQSVAPAKTHRLTLVSARVSLPKSLQDLQALQTGSASSALFTFDLQALDLPKAERNRKVNNVILLLAGVDTPVKVVASLHAATGAPTPVSVTFDNGVAFSNVPPITGGGFTSPTSPSPLNVLAGSEVAQAFTLTIDRAANADVKFSGVSDVLIGIDYTADLG